MMRVRALLVLAAVSLAARDASAQGSVFGIRGLGWSARPVSARTAATAGALAMFDPQMNANPAALTRWRSVAAWGVGAPTKRSYTSPAATAEQETWRFPLFGFAAPLGDAVFGFSISDYLDRTWTLEKTDSIVLRGVSETFNEASRSIGGISDLTLSAGYRVTASFFVGAGFHYYLGSTRLTAQRVFVSTAFETVLEQSQTDFKGAGFGVGALWTLPRLDISASARLNGTLRSHNSSGQVATTHLPSQLAMGLRWQVVPGVYLAGSAQYDAWARAANDLGGPNTARNVWAFGGGAEVTSATIIRVRTPLRLGYRTRTLPFTTVGQSITESAIAGGIGFNFANDRTTADFGFETGRRIAGTAKETFRSIFVGITVRP